MSKAGGASIRASLGAVTRDLAVGLEHVGPTLLETPTVVRLHEPTASPREDHAVLAQTGESARHQFFEAVDASQSAHSMNRRS